MSKIPRLIQSPHEISDIASRLKNADIIGVDTEFIRETTFFPKIALLQLATEEESWLLDPTTLGVAELAPILEVFRDPNILKVMHAAYADQECLYWAYGIVAEPVLDTAVAAALVGYGDSVGLGKLLKEVLRISLPKGRARVKWLQRPLPQELLQYAEQDVAHLVRLTRALLEKLSRKERATWAIDESRVNPAVFEVSPEDMARRLSKSGQMDGVSFNVLTELLRWREDRARSANMPRGWVADNEILVALAKVQPSTIEQLRSFRGLNLKEIEKSGTKILQAVKTGKAAPIDTSLSFSRPIPQEREGHLQEFIRTYLSFLADQHEIALRFLINTGRAAALAENYDASVESWVEQGILSQNASRLIGEELKALLSGQRALVLRQGKVEILCLDSN